MRLMVAAAVMAAAATSAWGQADEKAIAKLIDQLGAADYAEREAAEAELKKIGEPAVAALKKAVDDADAERADRARRILEAISKKPAPRKPGAALVVRDGTKGVTFKQSPDGKVELTVPETDEKTGKKAYKTYTADSMEDFKSKHPEVAKKYDVDQYASTATLDEFEKWWAERRRKIFEDIPDLDKWLDDQRKQFETPDDLNKMLEGQMKRFEEQMKRLDELRKGLPKFEEPAPRPADGREFGVKVTDVSETLRAQLDLKEGVGVQIDLVKPGSLAEKAGLKKHDIVVTMNGKTVTDRWEFRQEVRGAVEKGFKLEVIRGGKKQELEVKP